MQFIKLTRDDIPAIQSFEKEHAPKPPQYHINTIEELNSFFDDESYISYGIFMDSIKIGQVSYLEREPGVFYMDTLIIHQEYRKHGIAGKILRKIIKEVKRKGGKQLQLHTSPRNKAAVTFYTKHGFRVYDSVENEYGPGWDRIYMKLDLS